MSLPSLRMRETYGSLRLEVRGNSAAVSRGSVSRCASTSRSSRSRTSPATTWIFQGCTLVPDGAREAMVRISSINARGTGSGRKARVERRCSRASSTRISQVSSWEAGGRPICRGGPNSSTGYDYPPFRKSDMSRREDAKAERRHRIVTAARDLIRETGDTGLSMRAIAARARVSLSTPYNLFGSKRAIVLAVLEDIQAFNERFARLGAADAVERIFQVLSMSIRYFVDDPDFYRALWTGVFDLNGKEVRSALVMPERDAFWLYLVNN